MASASDLTRAALLSFVVACEPSPAQPPQVAVAPAAVAPVSSEPPSSVPPPVHASRSIRAQCAAFVDVANGAQLAINALDLDATAPGALGSSARKIEDEAKSVSAVDLEAPKLVDFRDAYAKNMRALASSVRSLEKLQAQKHPSASEAKRIETEANDVEKNETKLVTDINDYCTK